MCLIAALFLVGTLGRARQKPFWHDEIFTVVVAALPAGEVWSALRDGVDLSPPGFHVLTRVSQALFGAGPVGMRMPAAAGMLLAAVCAGVFVRRRCGTAAGLSAVLLLLCSDAYMFAYEARPYGLVLGFSAAALVCWQSAIRGGRRAAWLAGLAVSLAAAISSHYYAVLLFGPIAAGELARSLQARRPDWPLWIALGSSMLPLVLFWPLISSLREYSTGYFSPPSPRTIFDSYTSTLSPLVAPLAATLLVAAALATRPEPQGSGEPRQPGEEPEWIAAAALMCLPVFAFVLALWTNALVSRFYLPWTIGFSMLVPFAVVRLSAFGPQLVVGLATALFLWFGARQALSARWITHASPDLRSSYPLLFGPEARGDLPIVIWHHHVYLVAFHGAEPPLQARLVTLTPPSDAGEDIESETGIRSMRALQTRMPLRLEAFDEFIARYTRFLVYGPSPDPMIGWLRARNAVMVLRGEDPEVQRFAMSRPGPYHLYEVTMHSATRQGGGKGP